MLFIYSFVFFFFFNIKYNGYALKMKKKIIIKSHIIVRITFKIIIIKINKFVKK